MGIRIGWCGKWEDGVLGFGDVVVFGGVIVDRIFRFSGFGVVLGDF